MPFLNKNGIKYNLDSNDKTEQTALAPEFDSGATYSEGDLMTYRGELYRCDPTGSSIPLDPIAQAPFTITRDERVLTHGYTSSNSRYFVSDDIIQLGANSTYMLEIPSEQVNATTGSDKVCFCTYTQTGTDGTRVNYYYNSARITFTPTTSCYLSLSILKGYESGYKLYGTSTSKFVKVDVDTLLSEKVNTADMDTFPTAGSLKPVTSNGIKTALDAKADFVDTQEIISRYAIGNQYSSSATYNDGDYLAVQRDLYRVDSTGGVIPFGDSIFNKENTSTANGYKSGYALFAEGSEGTSGGERITEYMPVLPNTTYVIKWTVGSWQMWNNRYWIFYNSNKQYITERSMCGSNPIFPNDISRTGPQTVVFTTPNNPNIAYMRATVHNNVWDYLTIQPGSANNLKGVKIIAMDEVKRLISNTETNISTTYSTKTETSIAVSSLLSMIADEFDGNETYSNGDLFVLNNKLYKVNSAGGSSIPSTTNLYDSTATDTTNGYEENKYFNRNNPTSPYAGSNLYDISEYIPISPNTKYYLSWTGNYGSYNDIAHCYYDSNKTYISAVNHGNASDPSPKILTAPSTAAYIRLSVPRSNKTNIALYPEIKCDETTIADVIKELRNS